jgi:tRNA (cytidine/uridine-2'-O-)-methyltransferase
VFDIILFEPEIPANTGNILRLCANAGARLHLVLPAGFTLGDRGLKRAGLDYHDLAPVTQHDSWAACLAGFAGRRLFAATTKASCNYDAPTYLAGDAFVFGPESRGLPRPVLDAIPAAQHIRVPMKPGNRSLNLSNAVAVVLYEAWRQHRFA